MTLLGCFSRSWTECALRRALPDDGRVAARYKIAMKLRLPKANQRNNGKHEYNMRTMRSHTGCSNVSGATIH